MLEFTVALRYAVAGTNCTAAVLQSSAITRRVHNAAAIGLTAQIMPSTYTKA